MTPKFRIPPSKLKHGMHALGPDGKRTPEYRKKMGKIYRERHKEEVRALRRRLRKDPEYRKAEKLRDMYRMSLHDYKLLLLAQGFKCAICGAPHEWGPNSFAVDHSHNSGRVRGLLCHHCNNLLGFARDNAETLRKAAQYVETHLD